MSDKIDVLFFLEKLNAIRLHVFDNIRYSPVAQKRKNEQKSEFISKNHTDEHYDFSENEHIPGHVQNIGVYSDGKPCYFSACFLIILDLVILGWLQRILMLVKTGETFFTIRKVIQR